MSRNLPVLLILIAGCASSQDRCGPMVAGYQPGDPGQVALAPCDATYALYRNDCPAGTDPGSRLRAQVRVLSGCPIGFQKSENGGLRGVAGEKSIPLSDGLYSWQTAPDPSQASHWLDRVRNRFGVTAGETASLLEMPLMVCLGPPMLLFCLLCGGAGAMH